MNIICMEEAAFYALVEKVIEDLKEKISIKADKWISATEAMQLLRIKSKTTLQKLRYDKKIIVTQLGKRIILYDRDSIIDCLDDFTYETF